MRGINQKTRRKDMNAIKDGLEKPTLDRREGKWGEGRGEQKREGFHLINDDSGERGKSKKKREERRVQERKQEQRRE